MPERYINKKEENSMSAIEIKKVESRRDLRTFIEFHYDLYEGNPYDAPNLYTDEVNTLRKDKNAAFDFCEAEYFIAYRDGKVVGRVAAIINNSANEKWQIKAVRFGWIDFVDDIEVSTALLKAVEDYGRSKGMTEIVGPLGFTDMDPEGMLIKGFEELGTQATAYNYAYYPEHMERMGGWVKDNDYVEYKLYVPEKMPVVALSKPGFPRTITLSACHSPPPSVASPPSTVRFCSQNRATCLVIEAEPVRQMQFAFGSASSGSPWITSRPSLQFAPDVTEVAPQLRTPAESVITFQSIARAVSAAQPLRAGSEKLAR